MQVRFVASEHDQKRAGCTITRTRVPGEKKVGGEPAGAFEALPELLRVHPQLPGEAPVNREAHATGLESFHSDGIGKSIEANGEMWRQRSGSVRTPGGSGEQPSWQRRGRLSCKSSAQVDGSRARS